jgi:nitrile hydratase
MNGIHDMGGMHGFGPVVREENEPLFHEAWEARIAAIADTLMWNNAFTIDAFRAGIERIEPAIYLRATYYERWLMTVEANLIQSGVLDAAELDARLPARAKIAPAAGIAGSAVSREDLPEYPLPAREIRFAVGDAVVTRNMHPRHHTRLPRYARGKRGTIARVHGPSVFPDTNAHGLGDRSQVVYNVRFDAHELWGDSAAARQTVAVDLWESYLEPAEG